MAIPEKLPASSTESNSPDDDCAPGEISEHSIGVLAKRFSIWSTLGISYSITATPLGIGTYLSLIIGVGGSPVYFFAYITAVVFNLFVCASLAEISSVYPHASGKLNPLESAAQASLNLIQDRYGG
jgi:hypothetical protein